MRFKRMAIFIMFPLWNFNYLIASPRHTKNVLCNECSLLTLFSLSLTSCTRPMSISFIPDRLLCLSTYLALFLARFRSFDSFDIWNCVLKRMHSMLNIGQDTTKPAQLRYFITIHHLFITFCCLLYLLFIWYNV